jgi:hypothetical protein
MKYEEENRTKTGMMHDALGMFRKSPDTTMAAKSGSPTLTSARPTIPVSVPVPAGAAGGVSDVGGQVITGQSDLDTKPDARQAVQNANQGNSGTPAPEAAKPEPAAQDATPQPLPTNRQAPTKKEKKSSKKSGK